ncbi:MAG: SPOR domain-containing protein [Bacteroidaceae bacterium]|nr:SPOR domain-containing protein [Bacteroidaceae bacterium]
MEGFATCIEYQLMVQNSVSVPGLGTFVTQLLPARYSEEESLMLPPYRGVQFLHSWQPEDSSFFATLSSVFNISMAQAEQQVAMWLSEFQQTLEVCGDYDMGSLGMFTLEDDTLVFTAHDAGVAAPAYYALDAILMPMITSEEPSSVVASVPSQHFTIQLNRRVVHYVAAACAALLLYFMFGTPIENSEVIPFNQQAELFFPVHLAPASAAVAEESLVVEQPNTSDEVAAQPEAVVAEADEPSRVEPTETAQPSVADVASPTPEAGYYLIVASAVSEKNAERYVADLKRRGMDARVMRGPIRRVAVGHYAHANEAYAAVHALQQSPEFASAWVLHL